MKRVLTMGAILFLIAMLAGCGANEAGRDSATGQADAAQEHEMTVEIAIPYLEFLTLEDFLRAYQAARSGDYNTAYVETWVGGGERGGIEAAMEGTNFASLETLYLPVGIPEGFNIHRIQVTNYHVTFWYLPADVFTSNRDEFWHAIGLHPDFQFSVSRQQDAGSAMAAILRDNNATAGDLIDGKYLFLEPQLFLWESDGFLFLLYTPPPRHSARASEIIGMPLDDPLEMLRFTETKAVDLRDEHALRNLIEEVSTR